MPSICGGKLSRGFAESTAVTIAAKSPAQGQPDKSTKEIVLLRRFSARPRYVGRSDRWLLLHVSTCIEEARKRLAVLYSQKLFRQRELTPRADLAIGIDPLRSVQKLPSIACKPNGSGVCTVQFHLVQPAGYLVLLFNPDQSIQIGLNQLKSTPLQRPGIDRTARRIGLGNSQSR